MPAPFYSEANGLAVAFNGIRSLPRLIVREPNGFNGRHATKIDQEGASRPENKWLWTYTVAMVTKVGVDACHDAFDADVLC